MTQTRNYYYQTGTAAVRPDTLYVPDSILPTREQRERERRQEAARKQRAMSKQHKAAMRINRLMTGYMVVAAVLVCMLFVGNVYLQNDITTRKNAIAALETQISQVNADNKAAESRIATVTNINEIKEASVNNLGMVYAKDEQIVYYSMNNVDYMSQFKDIP